MCSPLLSSSWGDTFINSPEAGTGGKAPFVSLQHQQHGLSRLYQCQFSPKLRNQPLLYNSFPFPITQLVVSKGCAAIQDTSQIKQVVEELAWDLYKWDRHILPAPELWAAWRAFLQTGAEKPNRSKAKSFWNCFHNSWEPPHSCVTFNKFLWVSSPHFSLEQSSQLFFFP